MFRIIDRYLIKEILPYFFLCLLLLTAIIFVHEANRFAELFVIFSRRGLDSWPLVELTLSLLPSIFVFTLPISLLIGVLMGLGRMAGDSELIVLRASGMGRWRLLLPVLILALITATLTGYNTAFLLPEAVRSLNSLKSARSELLLKGIADQIKPGVFEESMPDKVIFIRDIGRADGVWRQVFVALDVDPQKEPQIVTAQDGVLAISSNLDKSELQLHDGFIYEPYLRKRKEQERATTSSFKQTSLRLDLSPREDKNNDNKRDVKDEITDITVGPEVKTLPELLRTPQPDDPRQSTLLKVEIQKRFALPGACLVFALIGVALGMVVARGGRSSGLMIGIVVTLAYYLLFIIGEDIARQGIVHPILGVWMPNLLMTIFGLLMLTRYQWVREQIISLNERLVPLKSWFTARPSLKGRKATGNRVTFGFPRLIDRMIITEMVRHFSMVLLGITAVFIIFTLFELTNDIVEHRIPIGTVTSYLLFLLPQIIHYAAPFSVLVAVLVTFGLFGKTSQLIALNASGQSLYRLALPALLYAIIVSGIMMASQEYFLPFANQRQEYLRYVIKGGKQPSQSFSQTSRKWFLGQENRLIHVQYFDNDQNKIVGMAVYELDDKTSSLTRRLHASEATWDSETQEWVLTNGFVREFAGTEVKLAEKFRKLRLKLIETPEFFKQQAPESSKMNIKQMVDQIQVLQASGIDVLNLKIALQNKFSSPLTCLVMAIMGIPFAFTIGKRGALVGVGVSIFIAITFWGSLELFSQLGRYELLPPMLSAWGPNMLFSASGLYLLFTTKT